MDLFPCWYGFAQVGCALLLKGENDEKEFEADKELLNIASNGYLFPSAGVPKDNLISCQNL